VETQTVLSNDTLGKTTRSESSNPADSARVWAMIGEDIGEIMAVTLAAPIIPRYLPKYAYR